MNTNNNNLYEKILYNRFSDFVPIKPLLIWKNANSQLNNKYKELGITDSKKDLKIKNTARHITGLGLTASQYGDLAYPMGIIKEDLDFVKDVIKKPHGKISKEYINDTIKDLINNDAGINYIKNMPNASSDDLMNYAINMGRYQQENNIEPLSLFNRLIKK